MSNNKKTAKNNVKKTSGNAAAPRKKEPDPKKQKQLRFLAAVLAVLLLPSAVFCAVYFSLTPPDPETDRVPYTGQTALFGSYPQSRVTDGALLDALNGLAPVWRGFDDCFAGGNYYGTMQKTDAMQYADVEYENRTYRGVKINACRPQSILDGADAAHSLQDDNGYTPGGVYWFLWEPISWYVADEKKNVLLSEKVLDATQINDAFYWIDRSNDGFVDWKNEFSVKPYLYEPANIYRYSDIRARLNGGFYDTAFSEAEKKEIRRVTHRADEDRAHARYLLHSVTTDRVWLYSAAEALCWQASGASADACFPAATDYALCRGAYQGEWNGRGSAWWWLRSPGDFSGDMIGITDNEITITSDRQFCNAYTVGGIRCAVRLRALPAGNAQGGPAV